MMWDAHTEKFPIFYQLILVTKFPVSSSELLLKNFFLNVIAEFMQWHAIFDLVILYIS